jgi:hypothetical protein
MAKPGLVEGYLGIWRILRGIMRVVVYEGVVEWGE